MDDTSEGNLPMESSSSMPGIMEPSTTTNETASTTDNNSTKEQETKPSSSLSHTKATGAPSVPLNDDEEMEDLSHEESSESEPESPESASSDNKKAGVFAKRLVESSTSRPPLNKPRLKKKPTTSAFSERLCTYKIPNTGQHLNPAEFINASYDDVYDIVQFELERKKCIKIVVLLECKMKKAVEEDKKILSIIKSGPTLMYHDSDLHSLFNEMYEQIIRDFSEKMPKGSGWTLDEWCELVIRIAEFTPFHGGTYIPTPEFIENKRCVVNVRNNDMNCFRYSILSPLLNGQDRYSVKSYQKLQHSVNFSGLPMPMPLGAIFKFEEMNPTYSVNVYVIDGDETIYPIRTTKSEKENHRDLLLLHSEDWSKFHYCCITKFGRLVASQVGNTGKCKVHVCKKCLSTFYRNGKSRLEEHKKVCDGDLHTLIELPKKHNDGTPPVCKFRKFENSYKVPFVVYADIVSYDDPESSDENAEKPVPLSMACYVHTHLSKELCGKVALGFKLFEGEDCIKQFVSHIEKVTENINERYKRPPKNMDHITPEKKLELSKQSVCHICDNEFKEKDETKTDYDQLTGEIRGSAHFECNFHPPKFVPVIYQGFDKQILQNLICEVGHGESEVEIKAENSETYISFQKKVGDIYIRFLDMFNFMSEDFEKLVKILPAGQFKFTDKQFHGHEISLLKRNLVFCNEYIDSVINPREMLPQPISAFSSTMFELKTSQADHKHACNVWREFGIKTHREYFNLHLKSKVTMLGDVFENFRSICFKHFNLDPCNYHTMKGITFDNALKQSRVELELLTDPEMFSMVEAGIRDDFVQVVTRYMNANNENFANYDRTKPKNHLFYFEANSIYATQMLEALPVGDFKFIDPDKYDTESIVNIQDDGEFGYIFEVSLQYPRTLHNPHSEHPYCQELRAPPNKDLKMLLGTLYDKENYVVHFRVLKQALESGLKLKKVHRVLQFKQAKWLKPVVEKITQLRRDAPNEFSKRFFKWALDSIHGKFLEDIRDKKLFTLVHTENKLQEKMNKFNFFDFHIFSENCVAMMEDQPKVTLDQPVYVGMTIMDLVKMQMNHFFYDVMKKQFGSRVKNCYEDSDTYVLGIQSDKIDAELLKIKEHFDFSNYPVGHLLHSESNKEKLGTFKNMAVSNPILSFVGIRCKCFAIRQRDAEKTIIKDDSDLD